MQWHAALTLAHYHVIVTSFHWAYLIADDGFFFEGNQVGSKMELSKQIQSSDYFEDLRGNQFRISASPSISKEIHALETRGRGKKISRRPKRD